MRLNTELPAVSYDVESEEVLSTNDKLTISIDDELSNEDLLIEIDGILYKADDFVKVLELIQHLNSRK